MRDAARIGNGLWPAAFVLRTRDAILRPNLHRYADDFIALFTQQISSHAGVYSTAHAEKNALLFHRTRNFDASLRESTSPVAAALYPGSEILTSAVTDHRYSFTGTLRNWLPRSVNRHG